MPVQSSDSGKLINSAATAERLGVSPRTLRRLLDAGKTPAPIRVGRCLRWRSVEIDAWIAAGCPGANQSGGPR